MWRAIGVFFCTLCFKLHMLCAAPLYSPVSWQLSLTLLYLWSFSYSFLVGFFYNYNRFLHFRMILAARLFSFFIACFLKDSQRNVSCNLYLFHESLYRIMLIFYPFKWRYCRHWNTCWNVLTYFCCRWIFRLFLHPSIVSIQHSRSA